MSETARTKPPGDGLRIGPFRCTSILAGDGTRGCGLTLGPLGKQTFARWCPATDEHGVASLKREYTAMLEIADLGVPRPLMLAADGERAYLLREYVEGVSVAQATPRARSAWAASLATLVARLESVGWVHGDICPKNVLVGSDGTAVIVDWELAVRAGDSGAPGTLGWTPPRAWDVDFTASCATDRFAAAVVVWEVFAGRRAFSGDREAIIREQTELCLVSPEGSSAAVRHLFVPAELVQQRAMSSEGHGRRTDPQRVGMSAAMDRAREIARVIGGADYSDTRQCVERVVEIAESHVIHVARALACHWMVSGSGPAVVVSDGADVCTGDVRARGAEALRMARRAVHEFAAHDWAGRPLIVSVANPDEARDRRSGEGSWLANLASCSRRDGRGPLVVRLRSSGATKVGPEFSRAAVRAVFGEGYAHWVSPSVQSGAAETLEAAIARLGGRADSAPSTPEPAAKGRVHAVSQCDEIEAAVRKVEELIVDGQLQDAYRQSVRASTLAMTERDTRDDVLVRLAECWKEMGSTRSALAIAERVRSDDARSQLKCALAAALDSADEIERILNSVPLTSDPTGGRARAVAVMHMYRQNAVAAWRSLRAVRLHSLRERPHDLVAHCLLLLSTARAQDRDATAARCHRVSARLSHASGTPREVWLCEYGGLLARTGRQANPRSTEWIALAESAEGLSLWRDARRMRVRGLRALVDEGRFEAAIATCSAMESKGNITLWGVPEAAMIVERSRWASVDQLERWLSAGGGGESRDSEVLALRSLLECEARGSWGSAGRSGPRTRSLVERLTRVLTRPKARAGFGSRAWRCMTFVQRRRPDLPGCAIQASRGIVCSEWHADRLGEVLEAARVGSGNPSASAELAIALLAVAVAWGREVSEQAVAWGLEQRDGFAGGRPSGVRRWEWSIGSHALESRVAGRPLSRSVVSEGLRLSVEMAEELPSRGRGTYEARVKREWGWARAGDAPRASGERASCQHHGSAIARELRSGEREESLDEAMTRCITIAVERSGSERGVIIFDRGDGKPRAKVVGRCESGEGGEVQVCHSVLARAEACEGVLVIDDAVGDPSLAERPSVKRFNTRSVAVVPIGGSRRRLGYLYLETRSTRRCLGRDEIDELALAGEELGSQLEVAALRDDCRSLGRDRERLAAQADRSGELMRLGQHVGEVVHDLRNALTVVAGEADLGSQAGCTPSEMARALGVIHRQALDGVAMLQSVLDLIRGGTGAARERVDAYEVAEEVLLASRSRITQARSGGAEVTIELAGCRGMEFLCVASELREVLQNLVSNAIDAMPRGGRLTVSVTGVGAQVEIEVRDTGVGMDRATLDHVFEPFFSTKGKKGNGLGLAICKSIVVRHEGSISVWSEVSQGTRFVMTFPRCFRTESAGALLDAVAGVGRAERVGEYRRSRSLRNS